MSRPCRCRHFLLRWTPDAVKGEFVNFAVAMFVERESGDEFYGWRMARDWGRIRRLDPEVDTELLEAMGRELERFSQEGATQRQWLLARMKETFSLSVQASEMRASLAEDPAEELERLASAYLETRRSTERERSGRAAIHRVMRAEFERHGVWSLMRKNIAAADYTHRGDPLKIDCGYRPNGVTHMFHALSIESDATAAKALAYSFPALREGLWRVEGARAELTAIVDEHLETSDEAVAFALDALRQSGVRAIGVERMGELAAQARRDLRLE